MEPNWIDADGSSYWVAVVGISSLDSGTDCPTLELLPSVGLGLGLELLGPCCEGEANSTGIAWFVPTRLLFSQDGSSSTVKIEEARATKVRHSLWSLKNVLLQSRMRVRCCRKFSMRRKSSWLLVDTMLQKSTKKGVNG